MDIVIDTNILIAALKTSDDESSCVKLIEDYYFIERHQLRKTRASEK